MTQSFSTDTRAVSNTLGYAFTFATIVIAIIFLITSGFGGLSDARDAAEGDNAVKAFDILSNNIEDLYMGDAPSRSTEIKLSGGQLEMKTNNSDATRISTSVYDPNSDTYSNSSTISYPLVYETTSDTDVVYDAGMIVRKDASSPARVEDPPLTFTTSRTVLTIVEGRGAASTSGDSTTLIITKNRGESLQTRNATFESESPLSVEMTIEAPPERLPAWKSFLESEGLTAIDDTVSDGVIVYEYETDRVLVRSVTVGFALDRTD